MIPFVCIILGSIITVVAAFFDYRQKLEDQKEQLDNEIKRNQEYQNLLGKSNALMEKSNNIITTQQTVIDTSKKIIDLQNQLNLKNEEIQKLQENTLNNITGGKNIPILYIKATGSEFLLKIINDSDLPLRGVSVEYVKIIHDLFTPSGNRTSSGPPNATQDQKKVIGDMAIRSSDIVTNESLGDGYKHITYIYVVKWLLGSYKGQFEILDDKKTVQVKNSYVIAYKPQIDISESIMINGEYPDFSHAVYLPY